MAELRRLQSINLDTLDSAALADHLEAAVDGFRRGMVTHFTLVGATAIPVGDYLSHCRKWGLPADECLGLLRGGSVSIRRSWPFNSRSLRSSAGCAAQHPTSARWSLTGLPRKPSPRRRRLPRCSAKAGSARVRLPGSRCPARSGACWTRWVRTRRRCRARPVRLGIGTGVARGRALVAVDPEDAIDRIEPGDVLVTVTTTPAFGAVMPLLAGVVTASGGALSHTAIVARELGVPAGARRPVSASSHPLAPGKRRSRR